MVDTVRNQILEALKTKFEGITAGQPVSNPYDFTWSTVTRGVKALNAKNKKYALAIVDVDESKIQEIHITKCNLRVLLEFRCYIDANEESSDKANNVMGNIQRVIHEDTYLGGLCQDIAETGNEIDIDTENDRMVSGVVYLTVYYRHRTDNPYYII